MIIFEKDKIYYFIIIFIIFFTAFILRLSFLNQSLKSNTTTQIKNITPDAEGYIYLAEKYRTEGYFKSNNDLWDIKRTPGYPTFLAVCNILKFDEKDILIIQVLLGSLIPLFAFLLVFLISKNIIISFVAGIMSAISPTGIGLSSLYLPDLLFSFFFAFGYFCLYLSAYKNKTIYFVITGVIFGIAALIKPVLSFWSLVSVLILILLLLYKNKKLQKISILIIFIVQLLIISIWCVRNYKNYEMFTLSIAGEMTMRYYLAVQVEQKAISKRDLPTKIINRKIKDKKARLLNKYHDLFFSRYNISDKSFKLFRNRLLEDSVSLFRRYPKLTIQSHINNIKDNTIRGWNYFQKQIPQSKKNSFIPAYIKKIESLTRIFISLSVILLFVIYTVIFFRVNNKKVRKQYCILTVFFITILYFSFASGFTYWTGPRILYPIEFIYISMFLLSIKFLYEHFNSKFS